MVILKLRFFSIALVAFFCLASICLIACDEPVEIKYPSPNKQIEFQIDQLLDKGEELLLKGAFESADQAFSNAISLSELEKDQDMRLCRALFDRSLVLAFEGNEEESLYDLNCVIAIVDSFVCQETELKPYSSQYFYPW